MNFRTYKEDDAKEINLAEFISNKSAYECYKSVGFKVVKVEKDSYKFYNEQWDCAEMVLEE